MIHQKDTSDLNNKADERNIKLVFIQKDSLTAHITAYINTSGCSRLATASFLCLFC